MKRTFSLTLKFIGMGAVALSLAEPSLALEATPDTPVSPDVQPIAPEIAAPAPLRLTLNEAVRLSLQQSPNLRASLAEARVQEARVDAARAETKPQLSTTGFLTTGTMQSILSSPPGVMPDNKTIVPEDPFADLNVMFMTPLYTGGRLSSAMRAARAGAAAANTEVQAARQDVALSVREAYHRALLAQEAVAVYRQMVEENEEEVRVNRVQFEAGKIPRLGLLRAEAELANAQQELNAAERNANLALVNLRAVMAVPSNTPVDLADVLAFTEETASPEDVREEALQNRPELRAARLRVEAAEAGVDRAKAGFRPQAYGVAMGDLMASDRMGTKTGITFGVTVGLPLLDAGLRRAEVEEARAMLERERANEEVVRIRVESEVEGALLEQDAARRNVVLSAAAVEAAEEQYRLARLRYESGKAIYVEVLDALTALTRARLNRAEALYEFNIAQDRFIRAVGREKL